MNIGDIYSFYNYRIESYNACQVTGFSESGSTNTFSNPSILLTDWKSDHPPSISDFHLLTPFVNKNGVVHKFADGGKPPKFSFCGNYPVLFTDSEPNIYGRWTDGYEFFAREIWESIPKNLREAREKAENIATGQMRIPRIHEDEILNLFEDFESFSNFSGYPLLSEIHFHTYTHDLHEYLKCHPFIYKLTLDAQQSELIDFRGSYLTEITINAKGVKEILLNDIISNLCISGHNDYFNGTIENDLFINDPNNGKFLNITIDSDMQLPKGIEHLHKLNIVDIFNTDLSKLIENHNEIEVLRIWGRPGVIKNISSISKLKKLRWITTYDIFGFSGEDFPKPEELPELSSLWMTSLPIEAAKTIKKNYNSLEITKDFNLEISKARKQEWLTQNFENPFSNWYDDSIMPDTYIAKATGNYKKIRAELMKLSKSTENPQLYCESIVRQYINVFNKMEQKLGVIDTVYREHIINVLRKSINDVINATQIQLDAEALIEFCDSIREF